LTSAGAAIAIETPSAISNSEPAMKLRMQRIEPDVVLVEHVGEIHFALEDSARDQLAPILGEGCYANRVLLDLSNCGYIDSAGIGWLMVCFKRFKTAGGRFVIHSATPMVQEVLNFLRIPTIIPTRPDEASALAAARA